MKNLKLRLFMYFIGLFIMTVGISLSVKSDLGVSPVSSVPYAATLMWGVEMGFATFLFHIVLVFIQFLLLLKKFKLKSLIQIAVGVVFGLFTAFCNYLVVELIPPVDNIVVRAVMLLISIVVVAAGIFLYVPADIMPLAGEGTMVVLSEVFNIKLSVSKISFDVAMSVISLCTCLIVIGNMGSVGIGTVVSAILTGIILGFFNRLFGEKRDKLLKAE